MPELDAVGDVNMGVDSGGAHPALDGVEVDEDWLNYYHSNINRVNNCIKVMNTFCGTSQQAFADEQCR